MMYSVTQLFYLFYWIYLSTFLAAADHSRTQSPVALKSSIYQHNKFSGRDMYY